MIAELTPMDNPKKPTIFFSHSSLDKCSLNRLKDAFIAKTGGAIDVFLSSDGESIPLGRNWVHRIQDALQSARIMVVFVSPNAFNSNWVYFESGFAYANNIRVVPVGFQGIDLATLKPPLSLLQGFNITSKDGLDNLIALVNEEFQHAHTGKFTSKEFDAIVPHQSTGATSLFGQYTEFIDKINIWISEKNGLKCSANEAIGRAVDVLKSHKVVHQSTERSIHFHGVSITATTNYVPPHLEFNIFPLIASITFPIIEAIFEAIREKGIVGVELRFDLGYGIYAVQQMHKLTGNLYGTTVTFGASDEFILDNLSFKLGRLFTAQGSKYVEGATHVTISSLVTPLELTKIGDLIGFLFERGVLFFETPAGS